jgi:predicted GIY-YIG superfamily endonuclease
MDVSSLSYHRRYVQEHRETINKYQREYAKQRVVCECGCELAYAALSAHKRTKKHELMIRIAIKPESS